MKTFIRYWYVWGILLLIAGILIAKNWKKIIPDTKAQRMMRNLCKDKCNQNYQAAVNNCNQYTGNQQQYCLQIATQEWDLCLSKCK